MCFRLLRNKAFWHVETLFVQGKNLVPSRPASGSRGLFSFRRAIPQCSIFEMLILAVIDWVIVIEIGLLIRCDSRLFEFHPAKHWNIHAEDASDHLFRWNMHGLCNVKSQRVQMDVLCSIFTIFFSSKKWYFVSRPSQSWFLNFFFFQYTNNVLEHMQEKQILWNFFAQRNLDFKPCFLTFMKHVQKKNSLFRFLFCRKSVKKNVT